MFYSYKNGGRECVKFYQFWGYAPIIGLFYDIVSKDTLKKMVKATVLNQYETVL